jgi:hypothetical protein
VYLWRLPSRLLRSGVPSTSVSRRWCFLISSGRRSGEALRRPVLIKKSGTLKETRMPGV